MEGRVSRGRGGGWKRGGRAGNNSESLSGEHRGRSRGGQHRGRGKRDHHRGRGRGGGAHSADFHQWDQDEGDKSQEDGDRLEVFSRRKLESNWDRYEESERQESDDTPVQRGTDYHVLLGSAGDSFTQFRFSEEKDWEMDPFAASQRQRMKQGIPDVPIPQQCFPAPPGGSRGIPRPDEIHNPSSEFWGYTRVSSHVDVLGKPPKEVSLEASKSDVQTTSTQNAITLL